MAHPRAGLMIHFLVRFKIRDDLLSHYLAKVNCLPSNTSIFKMKHSYSIRKTSHFRFKISFQPGKVQIARPPSPPPPGTFDNQMPGKMLKLRIDQRITDFCRNPWFQQFFSRSDSVSINYVYSCLFSFFFGSNQVTMLFKFALITMLATAFISEASANSCPRWVKLNKSPVCFGARDNQYGAFAYSQNVLVSSFMLVHRSGTVTCN